MKDSVLIPRSFYETIQSLDSDESKVKLFMAICEYGLNGIEMDLQFPEKSIWMMMKPYIDHNIKRYEKSVENGKKGGAPKGNMNAKKQPKTTEEQPENNLNQPKITQEQPKKLSEMELKSSDLVVIGASHRQKQPKNNLNQPKNNLIVNDTVNDNVNDNETGNVIKKLNKKDFYEKNKTTIHYASDLLGITIEEAIDREFREYELELEMGRIFN